MAMQTTLTTVPQSARSVAARTGAALAVSLLSLAVACNETGQAASWKPRVMKVGVYTYTLPSWWDSVKVEVPEDLKDWEQVSAYVAKRYGDDTGTKDSWKEACKTW